MYMTKLVHYIIQLSPSPECHLHVSSRNGNLKNDHYNKAWPMIKGQARPLYNYEAIARLYLAGDVG